MTRPFAMVFAATILRQALPVVLFLAFWLGVAAVAGYAVGKLVIAATAAEVIGPAAVAPIGEAGGVHPMIDALLAALRPAVELAAQHLFEALLAVLVVIVHRWTGIQLRTERRAVLHSAVESGIGQGLADLGNPSGALSETEVGHVVHRAVLWSLGTGAGDTVKKLKLGTGDLADLARAKLASRGYLFVESLDEEDEAEAEAEDAAAVAADTGTDPAA